MITCLLSESKGESSGVFGGGWGFLSAPDAVGGEDDTPEDGPGAGLGEFIHIDAGGEVELRAEDGDEDEEEFEVSHVTDLRVSLSGVRSHLKCGASVSRKATVVLR